MNDPPHDDPPVPETRSLPTQAGGKAPAPAPRPDVPGATTDFVPSYHEHPATELSAPVAARSQLSHGQCLGDFQILGTLGRGAFATVYLARQNSLGRQVALKVSDLRGSEARTLASLQHAHIVQVYSETVDLQRGMRLLCMQLVPGTTLERLIWHLRRLDPDTWCGQTFLEIIDSLSLQPAVFDPTALAEREYLGRCSFLEAVCWMAARLAEALSHAHTQGVLHRDIKPSNILISRYGRPLLADFNVSLDPERRAGFAGEVFGGTLEYMAPEHLNAFHPVRRGSPEAVDERSDIYSLAVVLVELLTGDLPFQGRSADRPLRAQVESMIEERHFQLPEKLRRLSQDEDLRLTLQRCLDPDPSRRYASADQLVRALDDCRERERVRLEMPPAGPLTRLGARRPIAVLCLVLLLPHLIGSVVNITYNGVRIVAFLSDYQNELFLRLTLGYNLVAYPVCLAILAWICLPLHRVFALLDQGAVVEGEQLRQARHRLLRLPLAAIVVSLAGWLPGGVLFPLVLHQVGEGLPADVFGHFLVSFVLSGLIALTYSVFGAQLLVVRVLYPRLLLQTQGLRRTTRTELAPLARRLRPIPFLAGLIPLAGAMLLIFVAPESFTHEQYRTFRVLVAGLIALGMIGFGVAIEMTHRLTQTLAALLGGGRVAGSARSLLRT